jgi:pyruvate dehydrogenase E2 component (dihydrolipoamide acetyltransferase)
MPTQVIMPQMGESIVEGTITKWLKKVGDKVARDEPLFEISTDKVDSEIPSPVSGILTEIRVPEGQTVQINSVVAVINGGVQQEMPAAEQPPKQEPLETAPALERPPIRPEPERPRPQEPARQAPPVPEIRPVEQPPSAAALEKPKAPVNAAPPRDARTSPLVRRLAREYNIDLSQIKGTGLEGRITKQDITNHLQQSGLEIPPDAAGPEEQPEVAAVPRPEPPPEPTPLAAQPPAPVAARQLRFAGETEAIGMTPMRKAIAEHMILSRRTSAHVHTVFEVDMTAIVRLREKHKEGFEKREGVKLTLTPFFVKALVDNVREFPQFNSSVSGDSIVFKKSTNVGVAVALENGLIVPVVKDAQLKSFTGLVLAMADLAERARTKRLKPDEVQNGTISVTNPGPYGSLFATPIINQPQAAILGIGGVEKRPVVLDDAIAIRSMVYLSLGFDHRIIDGAVADQFMAGLKRRLESWTQWVD